MSHVTLLLTRYPLDEFVYDLATGRNNDDTDNMTPDERRRFYQLPNGRPRTRISGMWGTMAMITGPRITYASFKRPPDEKLGQTRGPADMLSTLGRSPRGKGVPVLSCTNLG